MRYMQQALLLARKALGKTSPNPAVGAVVVKDDQVIGEGWTQPPGQDHAEIVALRQAGDAATGAALYVSLEPCDHFGRTPPCTQAIIDAGIAEVRVATVDPNPLVSGKGLSKLDSSGIKTAVGENEADARQLIEAYAKHITSGKPFVTVKFAMSLDGKIATRTGDSKWVTGEDARAFVHELRETADAVMVGIGTVMADNPILTTRDRQGNPGEGQPLRVVVDSRGRTPPGAMLLAQPGETLIAVAGADEGVRRALAEAGASVEVLPADDGSVNLTELMSVLGRREVTSVLVEGGGTLLGSLFDQGLVDKVIAFVAPIVIGGESARTPVEGRGVERLVQATHLVRTSVTQFGADTAITGYCEVKDDVHGDS